MKKLIFRKDIIYFVNLLPTIGIIISFLGFFKVFVYYWKFDINIIEYISFSEIITLFFTDFIEVAFTFSIMFFWFYDDHTNFEIPKRFRINKYYGKEGLFVELENGTSYPDEGNWKKKIITHINEISDSLESDEKAISWENLPDDIKSDYHLQKSSELFKSSIFKLVLFLLPFGIYLYVINMNNKIASREVVFLFVNQILSILLIFHVIELILRATEFNYKRSIFTLIALLSLYFQVQYSSFRATSIKSTGASYNSASIQLENNYKINTNNDTIYLGRTSSYIFTYLVKEKKVLSINSSKVTTMSIKKLENEINLFYKPFKKYFRIFDN